MCVHTLFVQLNPPFRDQHFSFTGHAIANPATNFTKQKSTRGAFGGNEKNTKSTTVFNKQKRTICVFKCWLHCQLEPFEALLSLEKTNDDKNAIVERDPFLRLVAQKRYPSTLFNFLFFSYHIGRTCPVKEFSWLRNSTFFGTKKGRDAHLQSRLYSYWCCARCVSP